MNVHQAIEFVEESKKFEEYKKEHAEAYLVHCFCTYDKEQSPWQIGYYSKKSEKITSFTAGEEVIMMPEDEAFIKEGHVPRLQERDIKLSLDEALKKAEELRLQNHSAENVTKRIIILQSIDGKAVWNVTIVTHALNLLNVRTNATTGEQISFTIDSVLNLGRRT